MGFAEAGEEWDLETLYDDLTSAKGKHLTPTEKLHLRGLLCGLSPAEIAEKLNKQAGGVETDLSATIYRYVKALAGIDGESKIEGWRKVKELLEVAGYKVPTKPEIRGMVLGASTINISDIKIEKSDYLNSLVTVFTLRLEIPTEKIVDSELQDDQPKV